VIWTASPLLRAPHATNTRQLQIVDTATRITGDSLQQQCITTATLRCYTKHDNTVRLRHRNQPVIAEAHSLAMDQLQMKHHSEPWTY
jgi:hypothetical protein